ncbi:uncharacterized protein LOC133316392 [Gastrolobium bilobum]|uniref:uncharacterized protein LOC133316392 n=1 Tax=Gastrolobium bilobum TaxID=150636 RepID=UPI002AB17D86|nr:uncharacterized protein LOC133316392 [Gastrolobium bilobum]
MKCCAYDKGCLWRVRVIKPVLGENWKITKWDGDHNCLNEHISQGHRQLDADVIADLVIGMIREEPFDSISLVQERITSKYGFKVFYIKAWYAKQKAMAIMYSDWEESYTPAMFDFERNLASFRESSPQIAEWIDVVPKEKWSRAYDLEGRRYGHMTTNLAESVNRVLKGARNMPITALVKHTYSRLVHYFVKRGTSAVAQLQSSHCHCKNVVELVKKNHVHATGHHVRAYNVDHTVFERFCQYGKFKAFKYPCSHAAAAALSVRQSPFTYIDDVFLTTNLVEAYSFPWEPIRNEEAIPPSTGPKIIPDNTMLRAKGRPKSTRIRNEMDEVETSQSRIRCGLCKERSHNRRACPNRGRND